MSDARAKQVSEVLGIPFFLMFEVTNETEIVSSEAAA